MAVGEVIFKAIQAHYLLPGHVNEHLAFQ